MNNWRIHNFVTGKDDPPPKDDPDQPTEAWIEGWSAVMYDGWGSNPYDPSTQEHHDWQDGYEAAERD